MRAFEVYVNGEKVCTAGLPGEGILDAHVCTYKTAATHFRVQLGGLDGPARETLLWPSFHVRKGDELTFRFVDADEVDPPKERDPLRWGVLREDAGPEPPEGPT